jgi:hypothetical protein
MRREMFALLGLLVLLVVSALVFFATDIGFKTTPARRSDEQNLGVNAPLNQAPSPGTVKDERGDPALPDQRQ